MTTTYSLTALPNCVQRSSDGAMIPPDPENLDYAAYLQWLSEGNVPEPYIAPQLPPITVSRYQFKVGLTKAGIRTQVEAAVAASADQDVKDAYAEASVFVENDTFITTMGVGLGLTSAQIHSIFEMMQTLQA